MRRETGLPIVTGERQCGTLHFDNLLAFGAADILNPDICGVGGMAEMQHIAGAATRHGVRLSPHCWNSPAVGGSAMVHFCLQFPEAEMAEFGACLFNAWDGLAEVDYTIADGRARLGGRPGLGVTPDTAALRRLSDIHTTALKSLSSRVSP
jgi:L-alanine-DL-glutamate epimerase-like enolase superfamily enzyme